MHLFLFHGPKSCPGKFQQKRQQRSASGQSKRPRRCSGPQTLRESSTTRWNNFTWLTWSEKDGNIILSKKCESLSLANEKSLSQWEIKRYNEQKSTLPKAGRHEGLKIPFWRQSAGSSPAGGMEKLGIVRWIEWFWAFSFCAIVWKRWVGERDFSRKKEESLSCVTVI